MRKKQLIQSSGESEESSSYCNDENNDICKNDEQASCSEGEEDVLDSSMNSNDTNSTSSESEENSSRDQSDSNYECEEDSDKSDSDIDSGEIESNCENERKDSNNQSFKNHSYDKKIPQPSSEYKKKDPIIPDSSEGGKFYYKINSCPYCDKDFARLDKHLLNAHRDKKTVMKIVSLPARSRLRIDLFSLLANIGNERFNKDEIRNPEKIYRVKRRLAKNRGKKISYLKNKKQRETVRREKKETRKKNLLQQRDDNEKVENKKKTQEEKSKEKEKKKKEKRQKSKRKLKKKESSHRVICPVCRGYYSKNTYSQHFSKKHGNMKSHSTRTLLAAARRELDEYHSQASLELIRYVLPYLAEDYIGLVCRHDALIVQYGNKYIEQLVGDDQAKLVKSHMRLMARVLCEMKALDGRISDLQSAIQPNFFDTFIKASQIICKATKKVLGVPYNGHTIRMIWNRLFDILDAQFSKMENYKDKKMAKMSLSDYRALFKAEYLPKIGSKAQRAQNNHRRLKAVAKDRPDIEDIRIFFKYLNERRNYHLQKLLDDGYDEYQYFSLMQYQVVLSMIFNGRRPGETERTRLENFIHRQKSNEEDEFFQALNEKEKTQASKFEKIICQGKKINGIDCAIYLTKIDIEALEILIQYRTEARVHSDNEYLFALPDEVNTGRMRHIDAYTSNIKLVTDCNANYERLKKPDLIRSTKCRSQIATMFGAIGNQQELENIANHLAHTKGVHFSHYRKSIPKNDVNITQFLEERLQIDAEKQLDQDYSLSCDEDITRTPIQRTKSMKRTAFQRISSDDGESEPDHTLSNDEEITRTPIRHTKSMKRAASQRTSSDDGESEHDSVIDDVTQTPTPDRPAPKIKDRVRHERKKNKMHENSDSSFEECKKTISKKKKTGLKLSKETKQSKETSHSKSNSKGARRGRGTCWTAEETTAFDTSFAKQLRKGIHANAKEIREAKQKYPCLAKKSEATIRCRFSNLYGRTKKKLNRDL